MPAQQELITAKKAAERLGVHKTTIYRWCREDKVPHKKIGGMLFIPLAALTIDLDEWQKAA